MIARLVFLLLLCTLPARAVEPGEMLADPALEQRARAIGAELRCLVCQNQSIDDSDADLAHDIRLLVRQHLQAGESDAQVIAFVVARYGDYVLLRPPFKAATFLLWAGPALLLLLGGIGVALFFRRRPAGTPAPLTEEERRKIEALLE